MSEEQAKYDGGYTNGGSAFPFAPPLDGTGRVPLGYPYPEMGMSLRDWFAGQALGAAWQGFDKGYYEGGNEDIAACAYQIADAMLAERTKGSAS